jgi:uncharacterized protein (TIGR03435 family)
VVGFLRPILLLPAGIAERLTPAQLEAVLAHELCHVRRRDNLFAAIHMFVEVTFWFHPLVWWIGARLIEERERACDEDVLRLGSEPQIYAQGILNVCKMYLESPLMCVSGVTGSDLKKRIEAILTNRIALRLTYAKKITLAVACMAALAMPVVIGILNAPLIRAQTPSAPPPKFEVAAIKLCKDGDPGGLGKSKDGGGGAYSSSPGRISTGCMPLVDANNMGLIQRTYVRWAGGHLNPPGITPIQGGPAWIRSELYNINAKAEGSPGEGMMWGPMLQALLEDRFKLKIHRETREVPVYALTVAKGGSKLKPFTEGSCTALPLTLPRPTLPPGQQYCNAFVRVQQPSVEAQGATLAEFSKLVALVFDRPVIDRTGIAGKFDIHLEFAVDESTPKLRPSDPDDSARGVSIFTAIQQQLGLKLESAKGPGEFLVIDRVERPSGN